MAVIESVGIRFICSEALVCGCIKDVAHAGSQECCQPVESNAGVAVIGEIVAAFGASVTPWVGRRSVEI